jgi:hypothetical protein
MHLGAHHAIARRLEVYHLGLYLLHSALVHPDRGSTVLPAVVHLPKKHRQQTRECCRLLVTGIT